jgi:hypothetical protein
MIQDRAAREAEEKEKQRDQILQETQGRLQALDFGAFTFQW